VTADDLPLPTSLSRLLIAFTIEFRERGRAPDGASHDGLARITNLAGLQRWGYVTVGPDRASGGPAPQRRDWVVRPARAGRRAPEM
jgi:hypothetical protein